MSHITEIKTKITDIAALQVACEELGFEFQAGQQTYRWYGRWVGDSPMPEGMTKADLGKCAHAISIPGCKYDVGVVQKPDGSYALAYDYWHSGGLNKHLGENAGPLVQSYAKHKTIREAARLGHRVLSTQTLKDGSVKLTLQAGGYR